MLSQHTQNQIAKRQRRTKINKMKEEAGNVAVGFLIIAVMFTCLYFAGTSKNSQEYSKNVCMITTGTEDCNAR